MGFGGAVWHVSGGGEAVGEILIDEADFPWLAGRFTPGPGYEAVRDLFARELALLERDQEAEVEAWEAAYDGIRSRVSLSSPDGPVAEFLLHIEGTERGSGGARSRSTRSDATSAQGRTAAGLRAASRRRVASLLGGAPNWRRYSRLNCDGLS